MNVEDIKASADRLIQKAERIERLTKMEGWADFIEVLEILLTQEIQALSGQDLDKKYYQKIGFIQMTAFLRAIPSIIKDEEIRNYLMHQGYAKSIQTVKNIPTLYQKQKRTALDQLQQIMGGVSLDKLRKDTITEAYKQS